MKLLDYCQYNSEKISINMIDNQNYVSTENMLPNRGGIIKTSNIPRTGNINQYRKGDILISNIRPYFKKIWHANQDGGCSADVLCIRANENISNDYLYYLLSQQKFFDYVMAGAKGCKMPRGDKQHIMQWDIEISNSKQKQEHIVSILRSLDDKIELNNRINANLEEQAQTLFRRWFVDFEFPNEQGLPYKSNGGRFVESELGRIPNGWKVFHADEVFHINIGKTPPRKEQEWFSNESKNNIKWVSISDLGGIGVFVNDSKEYLSKDAISKFNIIVVPRNTVLLSFKLTVGRVAIANCKLTTNEAIARFYLPKEYFREYTYLALKNYNYSKLGSTSSIAIAVNSKIIKAMPILIPSDNILKLFNVVMAPVFNIIEKNQTTIENLVSLRDTLLPKLMNNEINL